jgi:hypothetical protein
MMTNLAILNGNITAIAARFSAAIGTGCANFGNTSLENLTIVNGNIAAEGGTGIGTGLVYGTDWMTTIKNLVIANGNINATGFDYSVGIGSGTCDFEGGYSIVENLVIANGNITAWSPSQYGAGIGSGPVFAVGGLSAVYNLTILNGNITAIGCGEGPAIGSGMGEESASKVGTLTIVNGNISATTPVVTPSQCAAGIGAAAKKSVIENLSISGGTINATGGIVGIGSPGEGRVSCLRFSGTVDVTCNFVLEPDEGGLYPVTAESIVLSNASLSFATRGTQLFSKTLSVEGTLNLAIFYGSLTTGLEESLSDLDVLFLQIGNLSLPSMGVRWTLCVRGGGPSQCFATEATDVKSLVVSVPSADSYAMWAHRRFKSVLITNTTGGRFEVSTSSSFFADAEFILEKPTDNFTPALRPTINVGRRRIYQLSFFTIMLSWNHLSRARTTF